MRCSLQSAVQIKRRHWGENRKMNSDYFMRLLFIVMQGFSLPIMRFVSLNFNTLNNNAVRFLSGGMLFLLICLFKFRDELKKIKKEPKLLLLLFLLSCLMTANMFFYMNGLQRTSSLTGSIANIMGMPLSVLMAAVFFQDERETAKSRNFLFGAAAALVGSVLFILSGNEAVGGSDFILGSVFLLISVVIQAIQSLLVKKVSRKLHSIAISTCTATMTGTIYMILAVKTGVITELGEVGAGMVAGLSLAGMYGMITGMLVAFSILQKQGVVIYNVIQLIVPLSTAVVGYFLLGERVTIYQGLSAILVIAGCVWALRKDEKKES